MIVRQVDLIVMHGRTGTSDVESLVDDARAAITCDLVEQALVTAAFASIVVSTNDLALAEMLTGRSSVVVEVDPPGERFRFGRRLQKLIAKHRVERVVYFGGGSAPLLPAADLCELAERVRAAEHLFVANNFYSVDFCAFTPASALLGLDPPANDNELGWLLSRGAGLPAHELERTTATMFDVDTPVELLILGLHPAVAPHARAYLDSLKLDRARIEAASDVFTRRQGQALIAGRVHSKTMALLEKESACRTRVFSEERGMRADGRLKRGEVRSLLGMHMQAVGVERFFQETLPELGQAAFLDDRAIWAHCGVWPRTSDRFCSDLLNSAAIADPFLRRFTEAALTCPIPLVLGGHTLVSGGLYVLIEAAWARSEEDVPRSVELD
jgi:hypothetical protein